MFIQNHVDNLTPLREASEVDYGDGVDNGDIFQIQLQIHIHIHIY